MFKNFINWNGVTWKRSAFAINSTRNKKEVYKLKKRHSIKEKGIKKPEVNGGKRSQSVNENLITNKSTGSEPRSEQNRRKRKVNKPFLSHLKQRIISSTQRDALIYF